MFKIVGNVLTVVSLITVLLCGGAITTYGRTWTDTTGKHYEGELVDVQGNFARLRKEDGKVFKLPLIKLSQPDRDFITHTLANPTLPIESHKLAVGSGESDVRLTLYALDIFKPGRKQVRKGETSPLKHDYTPHGTVGTEIFWLIQWPRGQLLRMDGESKVVSCRDDLGTDLLGDHADMSLGDERLRYLGIAFKASPSRGATKILLKADLTLLCAAGEKTVEQKDFPIKRGSSVFAGPTLLKISSIETNLDGVPVVWLDHEGSLDAIKRIDILNPDGKLVSPRQEVSNRILLDEKIETGTIRIVSYEKVEKVSVPLDLEITVGL